ncbi:MAG: DUF6286 domain-containing protein [Egibacteraceae bacterium]
MIVVNRLLGLLLGLGLLTAGVIVVSEATLGLTGRASWLIDRTVASRELAQLSWDDPRALPISVTLLVIGIVLVLAQLKPRRPTTLPLPDSTEHCRCAVERRSVEMRLASVASSDDDVATASARVGRRRAKINARTTHDVPVPEVADRVRAALAEELARLGLSHRLKLRATSG